MIGRRVAHVLAERLASVAAVEVAPLAVGAALLRAAAPASE